jgi:hypothetical protein
MIRLDSEPNLMIFLSPKKVMTYVMNTTITINKEKLKPKKKRKHILAPESRNLRPLSI